MYIKLFMQERLLVFYFSYFFIISIFKEYNIFKGFIFSFSNSCNQFKKKIVKNYFVNLEMFIYNMLFWQILKILIF